MIKSIRLQNFFGFQDCTINLEKGENVLVGINGSGKSNFFKALKLLKEGLTGAGLPNLIIKKWMGFHRVYHIPATGSMKPTVLEFDLEFKLKDLAVKDFEPFFPVDKDGVAHYKYLIELHQNPVAEYDYFTKEKLLWSEPGLAKDPLGRDVIYEAENGRIKQLTFDSLPDAGKRDYENHQLSIRELKGNFYQFDPLFKSIEVLNIYEPFDTSLESKIRTRGIPSQEFVLSPDGDNLPIVLNTLNISDKTAYRNITKALKQVNSNFDSIDFEFFDNEISLRLSENELRSSITAKHISDGTLRFLCLMTIFYNPNRGKVICVDEPELGLHPDMIRTLAEAIKYAAETSQIIISTHSPELLNHFDVENIRVFEKDTNNATVVNQYKEKEFENFMEKYMAGQLWRQGHLGGNRW